MSDLVCNYLAVYLAYLFINSTKVRRQNLITAFLFISTLCQARVTYAQYSFESKTAIKFKEYDKWHVTRLRDTTANYSITVPGFFVDHGLLTIKVKGDNAHDSCVFKLLKNGKPFASFIDPQQMSPPWMGNNPKAVYVEDINGDGLPDLKISAPFFGGCGAFNFFAQIIYFIAQPDGHFKAFCFTDWMDNEDMPNRPEYDFDGDGNFEIVAKTFQSYGKHNYELYNIYNVLNGKLVNVNAKAGYPLMIQLLWAPNYKLTNKVSKAQIKKLAKPLPLDFKQLKIKWL